MGAWVRGRMNGDDLQKGEEKGWVYSGTITYGISL